MSEKKSGNVSIANIIALIGLAGIGVLTFLGMSFSSADGSSTGAVVGAVALVAWLAFLLFMSIKAKGAEDNVDKWRYVEYATLAAYVVTAVLAAAPFMRFMNIMSSKSQLQAQARSEVAAIKTMYDSYDKQQKQFMDAAVQQLKNYIASGQQKKNNTDQLAQYVSKTGTNIDSWAAKLTPAVTLPTDKALLEIEKKIKQWNYLQLPALAASLEKRDAAAWKDVTALIEKNTEEHGLIPVIAGSSTETYRFDGYAKFELGEPVKSEFANMLRSANGVSAVGVIVFILLNLMVLLNYLVARRSGIVGPGRKRNNASTGLDL